MSYDSFYRKTQNREAALKLLKKRDIILLIVFVFLFPALIYLIHFLVSLMFKSPVNIVSVILLSAISVVVIVYDFIKKMKNNYRFVHCSHDTKAVIKAFESGRELTKKTLFDNAYGGIFNEGKMFKYTYANDAALNCGFDNGVYTFSVLNDEWDEVKKFTTDREEDFDDVMFKALEYTASLEKQPDGEYDESLEVEVEIDEYEEDCEEEEDNEEEDEENKEA